MFKFFFFLVVFFICMVELDLFYCLKDLRSCDCFKLYLMFISFFNIELNNYLVVGYIK